MDLYYVGVLLWLFRMFVSCIISLLIGLVGVRILDKITAEITEFKAIKGNAEATALYVSGFMVFAGLVIHGSALNPMFLGQSILIGPYFNLERLLVVLSSVALSIFLAWVFYVVFAKSTPFGIDLDDINRSPIAIGAFMFCYEVYMGLVIHASLMIPL